MVNREVVEGDATIAYERNEAIWKHMFSASSSDDDDSEDSDDSDESES